MAEYNDSDLKGLMDVFQVKSEFIEDDVEPEEDRDIVHIQATADTKEENDNKHIPNEGYIMVTEEKDGPDDETAIIEQGGSFMGEESDDMQAAFDAEPEDLSTLGSMTDQDPDAGPSSSLLYNALRPGGAVTMQPIGMGGIKKKFDCRWCKASFTKKTSLRRHMNLHSGSRPFQCPFCEYNATRKDQLKTHIKTRHTRDSSKQFTFKCPLCSNMFQSQRRMTLHMRSHQWDNFPCDLCHIKFKSAHELVQHLKRRHPDSGSDPGNYPYVCDVCHRWCHSIEEYVDHIQTHPQRSLESPDSVGDRASPGDASHSNGQSRLARMSILEQALSKGNPSPTSSSRNRFPSESSNSSQRPCQRPESKLSANSSTSSSHGNQTTCHPSSQGALTSASMLSRLLQGGQVQSTASSTSNGPYIMKAVSLNEGRNVLRYPQYPVRNQSPLSNSSSSRMPHNVVSPTISRDSRESLDAHSPQLSSNSSISRSRSNKMMDSSTQDEVMRCEHCHTIFADSIMYAIHMGCHDWQEPFRCNICAFHCADRYEFMSHITRGLHQKR
ncbi:DNA-binding protein Ikaros-like [Lytechinus pictus]|uniref:DNA-binding protein Ikaros-like n=1 Tax=Lytechinus pictus TaxID=7653 RepID=UPI00240E3673|nr:DNA-binding protein Ikaros-like [Lytechinus pictus]